jgi:hypothetical protein
MRNYDNSGATAVLLGGGLAALLAAGGAVGWVRNIIAVTHSDFNNIDGELVVRVVGIPMVPIGAIMGWVP